MDTPISPPKAFISYSWDTAEHQEWVKELAARLRSDGVEAVLDKWSLAPGDKLPVFMETAVRESDYVLIVCTPKYKARSDKRQGGVGYEGDIMTGEVMNNVSARKFIPILRHKKKDAAIPSWLGGKLFIDLSDDPYSEDSYRDLLHSLHGFLEEAPPVGSPPPRPARATSGYSPRSPGANLKQQAAALLAKAQSRQVPLAVCIAEAMPIAAALGDSALRRFCELELAGYGDMSASAKQGGAQSFLNKLLGNTMGDASPSKSDATHRAIKFYVSISAEINTEFMGWGDNISKAISYMERDTEHFNPMNIIVPKPIAEIEREAQTANHKALLHVTVRAADLMPSTKIPDHPVHCYARGDAMADLVERVRSKFTGLLVVHA